ncbi:MAG: hypothetical protein K5679_09310 [Lachnospiraceae bacterium]|nr:hypothetical protein [Lachnospiraceae bacterium]
MRIKKLLMTAAIIGVMCCYGCGDKDAKPAATETSVSQETVSESAEASTSETSEEGSVDPETEADPEELIDYGEYYSQVVVTGIDEYSAVGYSIAGFMDGSLFQLQYIDENDTEINGDFSPAAPDKIVFEFDNTTGEAVSAVYYGTYPDEEAAGMGVEAFSANADLMGDDVVGLSVVGNEIMVAFDPHSARFNNTIRTYFLEGHQDPEGYTKAVEKDYESTTRDKSTLKGDDFACDAIHGLKVTWYK